MIRVIVLTAGSSRRAPSYDLFSVYGLWEADKYIRGACVHVCMCILVQICTHLFTVQEIAFQVPSQTWG